LLILKTKKMKLSEFKTHLAQVHELIFKLPNGEKVPTHFHVTEIGQINKHFIDCGGTIRNETKVNFQLWQANDFDHRLAPQKLKDIIQLSENKLGITDAEIEVEYQGDTIGKYGIIFQHNEFILQSLFTDCLASDQCGVPKQKIKLKELTASNSGCCEPGGGCC